LAIQTVGQKQCTDLHQVAMMYTAPTSFYRMTACNATHSIAVTIPSVCQMRVL